ncbi:UDP-N-acetylmuramate:L-alanyl-gamma-D-glutamyl-meso-diaminopimelate ligase [Desulfonema limicola]|uniref:UDP-N-acetylmuramate:L-alanyl-gamma-D-glutamyl-meso-diaminopimelate ligase n=1 Tax=Desulfonema limicola TaxID=45656 RepID=A0A975GEB3_9BACT|nr:UDP-N-acetylmuramate:L-alanyl-gamma-D-glutamyl-meso-diaminopimelate ligase [Desulfonema limicola]QTA78028.1 UDP-N-acetylmuramate:L-alanyl-gamma-D-glutamyl-meso-diaminopimelate ligase [Desulfonema limicola]
MDLSKNHIPDNVKNIHLTAICGTGMGALAGMLKEQGFNVSGSDQGVYPPMSDFLEQKGIKVISGFSGNNLSHKPGLVIVGNAVTKNNPEAQAMFDMGLNFCSMPQALNHFAAKNKKILLITGTHGKTTTSSILAWLLYRAGLDPGFFIGGILRDFNSNYALGKGEYIVIEGDEYDTAFFDKGPKFLHYNPFITVLTSIEFDHADIFKDIEHIKSAFDRLISGLPAQSVLIGFDNDKNVEELVKNRKCQVLKYGKNQDSLWILGDIKFESSGTVFEVLKNGNFYGRFQTGMLGEHNLFNALSVIAVADRLNISKKIIALALETFQGPKRRQEIRGIKNGITIIDDFAHHPTAVRETIKAVKPLCRKGRLIAVFEPRTNTSMRRIFQDVYPFVFDNADMVCIRKPSRLDKIPDNERFSSEKLVEDIKKQGKQGFHFEDTEGIIEFLQGEAKDGDVILIMSNGGFDNIHARLLEKL